MQKNRKQTHKGLGFNFLTIYLYIFDNSNDSLGVQDISKLHVLATVQDAVRVVLLRIQEQRPGRGRKISRNVFLSTEITSFLRFPPKL